MRLPAFLAQAVPNSDTVSAPLLATAISRPGHGAVFLGNHAGYSDLLLSALALHLPDRAVSSQAVTWAVYAAGALLLTATLRRLGGWTAAGMGALLGLAATPALLASEASPTGRVTSLANLVLLGWLASTSSVGARRSRAAIVAAALAIGVVTGLDAVSDPLLVVVGVLPFIGTGWCWGCASGSGAERPWPFGIGRHRPSRWSPRRSSPSRWPRTVPLQVQPNPVQLASFREVVHTLHVVGGDTGVALGGILSTLGSGPLSYIEGGWDCWSAPPWWPPCSTPGDRLPVRDRQPPATAPSWPTWCSGRWWPSPT